MSKTRGKTFECVNCHFEIGVDDDLWVCANSDMSWNDTDTLENTCCSQKCVMEHYGFIDMREHEYNK